MTGSGVEYRVNPRFVPDNVSIKFGSGMDSRLYYDGTNLVINPKAVGSGYVDVQGSVIVTDSAVSSVPLVVRQEQNTALVTLLRLIHDRGAGNAVDGDGTSLQFQMLDDGDVLRVFADITVTATDVTSGGPGVDGKMVIRTVEGGSLSAGNSYTIETLAAGASSHYWAIEGSEKMRLDEAGALFIGDTANAKMTVGLTINQGANDNEAFTLKSSDVDQLLTDFAETDTYANFQKAESVAGGLLIRGFKDDDGAASGAVQIEALLEPAASTIDTSSGRGVLELIGGVKDGANGRTAVADAGNLLAFVNRSTTRAILKGNGDWHVTTLDGSSVAGTVLDDIPDALAGRALRTEIAGQDLRHGVNVYDPGLVRDLEEHGVISTEDEGGHRFMSLQGATYFAWDMGFQNAMWLRDIVNVLTDKQRDRLPAQTRDMLALMPAGS